MRPVAFRQLPMMEAVAASSKKSAGAKQQEPAGEHKSKLIIEEPEPSAGKNKAVTTPKTAEPATAPAVKKPSAKATRLGSLEHIRQQFANNLNDSESNRPIPLNDELLKQHWEGYTHILREKKNPAVQSFDLARLTITSDNSFEVLSNNNLEHRFIEQERRYLSEFLQEKFNNRSLSYSISVSEIPVHHIQVEKTLNKKEQFLQIVEQYPIIREMKDRLKLELDY